MIEEVWGIAMDFLRLGEQLGTVVNAANALRFAMQILCSDPEPHLLGKHPAIWSSDDHGKFSDRLPDAASWTWRHPLGTEGVEVRPAIIHVPRSKALLELAPKQTMTPQVIESPKCG